MINPKIEQCIAQAGNKYTLAVIVAKRAKDLTTRMAAEFTGSKTKELTYALEEISAGKIIPHYTSGN